MSTAPARTYLPEPPEPEPSPDPPLPTSWGEPELAELLRVVERARIRLSAFAASGGLAACRGRARPVVLAGLDRHLDAIRGLADRLLDDPRWVGRDSRNDRRYRGGDRS